jgi:N6-adenosine-specific RNA methylase IME4
MGAPDTPVRYRTIVADPPWRYQSAATKADAGKHYPTMSLDELAELPIRSLAAGDAHLWLWGTNAMLEDAYWLARVWGFRPITLVTWCKKQPGVGYYLRNNTEQLIFATRGKPMVPEKKPLATWYVWPRGEHSRKPDASYDLVEQVSPGPYLELFARRNRLGWDTWGNECLQHVEATT